MATIASQLKINDGMSSVLKNISKALNLVIDNFETMQQASGQAIDVSNMAAARREIALTNSQLDEIQNRTLRNTNTQNGYTRAVRESTSATKSMFSALAGFSIVHRVIGMVVVQLDAAINRMDTMSNFERTMTAITGSSDAAKASLAELKTATKGTAYGLDTAASSVQNFTTRGMSIGNSTREVVKWMDAVAFYGKGTNEQFSNVTDALGKMMSKGTVEMEQLNRLTDAGINAVGIYAQATGKSTSEVQSSLSKGAISSIDFITTVSTAFTEGTNGVLSIAGAAKEAGGTWATSIANMRAAITRGVISVIDSINGALSDSGFGTILEGVQNFGATMETVLERVGQNIARVIKLLSPLFKLVKNIGNFVKRNWSLIRPIILGIVTAIVLYNAVMAIHNTVQAISTALKSVAAVVAYAHGAATLEETLATLGLTKAQWGFNAALYACPITWIVLAIIAAVAALYLGVAALNKFAGTSISATGIVMGLFSVLGAFIMNQFIMIWNVIAMFINFFGNVFNDPCASIAMLFLDLFLTIGGWLAELAHGIEDLFGKIGIDLDLSSGLDGFVDDVKGAQSKVLEEAKDWRVFAAPLEQLDYGESWNTGYNMGAQFANGAKDLMNSLGADFGGILDSLDSIDENTGNTAASLKTTEEDLKYMRDLAEQEVINRFTTAEVKIDMTGMTNRIDSNMDLDGVLTTLTEGFAEALETTAEGVHA